MANHESTITVTDDDTGVRSLDTLDEIGARYRSPGPHTTLVMATPIVGSVGDDITKRWHATRTELQHLGASAASIAHLDRALASVTVRAPHLLATANDDSVAITWITLAATPFSVVGPVPALFWATRESLATRPVIAAVIDRIGADLYEIGRTGMGQIETVDGEHDFIHKAASGGWSQARQQRHSETVWSRNADRVAAAIAQSCDARDSTIVLMTGDERAVGLTQTCMATRPDLRLSTCRAGARGDPDVAARLRDAATSTQRAETDHLAAPLVDRLTEELGQRDRGVEGSVAVLEASTENRVRVLLLDEHTSSTDPRVDATLKSALDHRAQIVIAPLPEVRDGVGALLRIPY